MNGHDLVQKERDCFTLIENNGHAMDLFAKYPLRVLLGTKWPVIQLF